MGKVADELSARSKIDYELIVGSEIRAALQELWDELDELKKACKTWLDSPNNRPARATVRELCKINHDGTEKRKRQHPMNEGVLANMGPKDEFGFPKEDWDCGCSDAATDVCVSITCPRR